MISRALLVACALVGGILCGCGQANTVGREFAALPNGAARAYSLKFRAFTAGQTPGFSSTAVAIDLTPGANRSIWFTDVGTPAIGRIAANGTVTEFTRGLQPQAQPYAIAMAPDGNMWFSDRQGVTIGKVTPSGTITEFANTKRIEAPGAGVAFDSSGRPWAITSQRPGALEHLTAKDTLNIERVPAGFTPDGSLAGDSGGNLWYTGYDLNRHALLIERLAETGKTVRLPLHEMLTAQPCCPNRAANPMVIGPGGVPWFTTMSYVDLKSPASHLGTLQNGQVELIHLTHRGLIFRPFPNGVDAGGSTIWVSGSNPTQNSGALWRITSAREQTAYPIPYNPISLTVGSTGNPWFTAGFANEPSQIIEVLGKS